MVKSKISVLYASRGGNTKKVANAISMIQESTLLSIQQLHHLSEEDKAGFWDEMGSDICFVGTGIYADHVDKNLHDFFIKYPPKPGMNFALFATWLGRGNSGPDTLKKLENYLVKHGATVLKPFFLCYGQTLLFKSGHPNPSDLQKAKKWATDLHSNCID